MGEIGANLSRLWNLSQAEDLQSFHTDSPKSILCSYPMGSSVTLAGLPRVGGKKGIKKLQKSRLVK